MSAVVEVRFKGNRLEFFNWTSDEPLGLHDSVVVEVERGQDLGRVSALGDVALKKCARGCGGCPLPEVPATVTRRVVRRASSADVEQAEKVHAEEDAARRTARDRVRTHSLPMKISDAEWQWDRRKLTLYFTAEQRVDFRALVRDLAAVFRTRIELRQIGARDEARRLSGVGRCGREYCSASWLPELRPVNLSVAKDQHLSLNPSQISGPCGRLLCCLHYEHEFYVQSRKRFPKEGKVLQTAVGPERVLAVDIFRDRVTLRSEEHGMRVVALERLREELGEAAPEPAAPTAPAAVAAPLSPPDTLPAASIPAPAAADQAASPGGDEQRRRRRRRRPRGGGGRAPGA
ncbi:MAG TPA: regulatory iron-sulfur-containing complex subunit RicT [Gemmatimonadales bacterium]|nr:regulatory iron-sulfur-containing complex subunit RicT [Gemmatimonadales bacterium]